MSFALRLKSRPRTSQPQTWGKLLDERLFVVSPSLAIPNGLAPTGSPSRAVCSGGVGFKFGSGNYYSGTNIIKSGTGSGNELKYNSILCISFVVSSNAVGDPIASLGMSPTDATPWFLLENTSGTLRLYINGSYRALGSAVIGKLHTVCISYSDASPYSNRIYLDGNLITTVNLYRYDLGTRTLYLGSAIPGQMSNGYIVQAMHLQPGNWMNIQISNYSANPWQIFQPSSRRLFLPSGSGGFSTNISWIGV
jgi:hypothetical protein